MVNFRFLYTFNMASKRLTVEQVLNCMYSKFGSAPPQISLRAVDFIDTVKVVCLTIFNSDEKRHQKQVITFFRRKHSEINQHLGFVEDMELVSAASSKSSKLMNAIECLDVPDDLTQQSHHDAFSGLAHVCLQMGMKNNKSNRLLLKRKLQRSNWNTSKCGETVESSSEPTPDLESVVPLPMLHTSGALSVCSGIDATQKYMNRQITFCPPFSSVYRSSQIPSSIERLFKANPVVDIILPPGAENVARACELEERPSLSFK